MLELLWRLNETAEIESPRMRMRRLLDSDGIYLMPGIFDGLSARVCEQARFECAMISRSLVGLTLMGMSDSELVGLDQLVSAVTRVTAVMRIPLYVDAGPIPGGAAGVAHVVRRMEKAGASAVRIGSRTTGKELPPTPEETVELIKAATTARQDPDLVIVACCDLEGLEDPRELDQRYTAYAAAGADIVRIEGLKSLDMAKEVSNLKQACSELDFGEILALGGSPEGAEAQTVAAGCRLVALGDELIRAGAAEMAEFAKGLRAHGIEADIGLLKKLEGSPLEDWYRYTGFDIIRSMEDRFLPTEALDKYKGGPVPYYLPSAGGN